MENVDKIQKIKSNADNIRLLILNKIPKWNKDQKHYDKTGWGFNIDNRFSACTAIAVSFDSYMGVYGDSGCSNQCSLNADIFGKHLLKYLNTNKEQIMLAISDSIIGEAKTLKEAAEKELKQKLAELNELS